MTCIRKVASFPNSRIRTRRPTRTSTTYDLSIASLLAVGPIDIANTSVSAVNRNQLTTNGNTIVSEADPLTTYITLRNIDPSEPMFYSYVLEGQADNFDVTAEGQLLRAGDSVDLEVTDSIVIARGASSVDSAIPARVDKGIG